METQKVKANGCLLRKMENGNQHAPFIYILRLNKLVSDSHSLLSVADINTVTTSKLGTESV